MKVSNILTGQKSLLLALMMLSYASAPSFSYTPTNPHISSKTYSMDKETNVKPGKWGATGIILTVEKNVVSIGFDCADAKIERTFKTTKSGSFSLVGTYTAKGHGPIRLNNLPKPQAAKFTGKVTGKKMTLKVTLTETGEVVGEYTLERGVEPKMHYCR